MLNLAALLQTLDDCAALSRRVLALLAAAAAVLFLAGLFAAAWAQPFACLPQPCGTGTPPQVRVAHWVDGRTGIVAAWACPSEWSNRPQLWWTTTLPADSAQQLARVAALGPEGCPAAVAALAAERFTGGPLPEWLGVEARQALDALPPAPRYVVRTNGTQATRPTYHVVGGVRQTTPAGTVAIRQPDGSPTPCYVAERRVVEGANVYAEVDSAGEWAEVALCSRVP